MAVMDIIQSTKELFPGSNVIAIIRSRVEELQREDNRYCIKDKETEARLARWKAEAAPMPEDCRLALVKLGIKLI